MAKVLVSFEDALLRRIDRVAGSHGLTRSAYLAQLAERDVASIEGPGRNPEVRAALEQLEQLFAGTPSEDSTEAVRAERQAR